MLKISQKQNNQQFGKYYGGIFPSDHIYKQSPKKRVAEVANNLNNTLSTWIDIVVVEEIGRLLIRSHKQKTNPLNVAKNSVLTDRGRILKIFKGDSAKNSLAKTAKNTVQKSEIFNSIKVGIVNIVEKQKKLIKSPDLLSKIGSNLKKITKANLPYMAAAVAIELGVNVIPAYKEKGKEKGDNQLKKSTVQVIADILGWEACFGIGKSAGMLLPKTANVFGFLLRAVMGATTGFLGSCLFCKLADNVVEKNKTK